MTFFSLTFLRFGLPRLMKYLRKRAQYLTKKLNRLEAASFALMKFFLSIYRTISFWGSDHDPCDSWIWDLDSDSNTKSPDLDLSQNHSSIRINAKKGSLSLYQDQDYRDWQYLKRTFFYVWKGSLERYPCSLSEQMHLASALDTYILETRGGKLEFTRFAHTCKFHN